MRPEIILNINVRDLRIDNNWSPGRRYKLGQIIRMQSIPIIQNSLTATSLLAEMCAPLALHNEISMNVHFHEASFRSVRISPEKKLGRCTSTRGCDATPTPASILIFVQGDERTSEVFVADTHWTSLASRNTLEETVYGTMYGLFVYTVVFILYNKCFRLNVNQSCQASKAVSLKPHEHLYTQSTVSPINTNTHTHKAKKFS
jgi:hypothetical protein